MGIEGFKLKDFLYKMQTLPIFKNLQGEKRRAYNVNFT